MVPLSQDETGFTEKMREELSLLQQQIEAGNTSSSFPWDTYDYLKRAEYEHAQSGRFVKRPYLENAQLEYSHAEPQEVKGEADEPSPLDTPQPTSAPVADTISVPVKKQIVVPTLEGLCKAPEYAAKIDAMLAHTRSKIWEGYHGAVGAAVYKTAVWLGMVHGGVTFSQWGAMLLDRYGISVSGPISKYRIDKPQASSSPFRKAVLVAFSFAQSNSAIMAKRNPLPAIYQHIPAETGAYQK